MDRAHRSPDENPAVVRARVNAELNAALVGLETVVEAEAKRARILGYSGSVVAASGILSGTALGVLPAMLAAFAAGATVVANYTAHEAKLKGRPYYFLWRARR